MKFLVIKKRNIIFTFSIFFVTLIVFSLFSAVDVTSVMSAIHRDPITSVETEENKVALSVNVYENTDVDFLLEAFGGTNATFFVSEAFQELHAQKVREITAHGHTVGILEDNMRDKTRKEINDRIAARIERLSFLTGNNTDLVRFNNNSFDTNCIDAIFSLGLYPVQWSTDDTAENFSSGDIILITGESEVAEFIQKITADGFETSTVDGMILRRNYIVDLGGTQLKR